MGFIMEVGGVCDALTYLEMGREIKSISVPNNTHWLIDVEYYYGICINQTSVNESLINESNSSIIWYLNTLNKLSETDLDGCTTIYRKNW